MERVLVGELLQAALLAALGRADLDPRSAPLASSSASAERSPASRGTTICGGTLGALP